MKFSLLATAFLVLAVTRPESSEGYRILCVFPLHVSSHFVMFESLTKGLARKGHQVDVVSSFPQKKPYANYTDIIVLPSIPPSVINNITYEEMQAMSKDMAFRMMDMGIMACEQLGHPQMLKLIKNPPTDPPYDLVITQFLVSDCFITLGHHLKVPVIGAASAAFYPWQHSVIANPANLAFVSNNFLNYIAPMTFWQRLHNTVSAIFNELAFQYVSRAQDDIIRKYLGEDAPGVRESESSLALVLVNSHLSLHGPKPMTPAVIEVGGLHIQDSDTELSQDLKDWMDNSTDGFVYFSFGSMLLIESFPQKIIEVIYKSFGKLAPIRVLIKIPNPHLLPPGMPENFRTFKWVPQNKILKHKNVKAFMTHGGLMGTQEAIYYAVPLIGVPFLADQFVNIDHYSKMKVAVGLKSMDITEEQMDAALNEVLYNPVYKDTVTKVSMRFIDRPMSSLETATWWVEYVVRHGNFLRSPAMDLTWWQVELLDVYVFILFTVAFIVFIVIILIRFLVKELTVGSSKVIHTKKVE